MARNPRLTVIFSAVTDGFNRGVNNAQKRIAKFRRSIVSSTKAVVKWGAVLTGVAVGALGIMVKRQFEALDKVAKLSDRIGIQTEKLAGLSLAASQAGVSNEIFVKSIEKMQQVIGDATLGLSESIKAFEALGLSFEEIAKKGTFQQLLILTDALNKVEDATLRAALAADLFGRAGSKELRNFLALGSTGIRAFIKEADRLGIAFRRIDLARIEAANDALDKMARVSRAVAGEIAINLSGAITHFANSMNAVGEGATSMREIVKDAFVGIREFALDAAASIDKIVVAFKFVQLGALGVTRVAQSLVDAFPLFGKPIQKNQPRTPQGPSIAVRTLDIAISDLKNEIAGLLDRDVLPTQSKLFGIFQAITNTIGDSVAKLLVKPVRGGDGGGFAIKNIAASLGVGGAAGGISGLRTATELGISGGQPRFTGGAFQGLGRALFNKVSQIANDIAAIRRAQQVGPLGITIV